MWGKRKILVTGGAGFIGSHLVDRLVKERHRVVVVDNLSSGKKENISKEAKFYKIDICSPKIFEIFRKEKPEIVFHLAAQKNVRKSVEDPIFDAKVNILGSLNILKNSAEFKVKKIIFASSGGAVYGNAKRIPTPENYETSPISPYGIAKLTVENYLKFYKQSYNLDFISLRLANVYGPRQDPKGEVGVVSIFIDNLLKGKRPVIFGDGEQTRDFIYVDDVCKVCILAMRSEKVGVYNVGTGVEISINDLYGAVQKVLNKRINPIHLLPKEGEVKRSCLDITKAHRELKWVPKISLKEGLKKVVGWFEMGV